jgi:hypothetical protein
MKLSKIEAIVEKQLAKVQMAGGYEVYETYSGEVIATGGSPTDAIRNAAKELGLDSDDTSAFLSKRQWLDGTSLYKVRAAD